MDCSTFSVVLQLHSPSSLPYGIALTSHMWMEWEYGYGKKDMYLAEQITPPPLPTPPSPFRAIMLCTRQYFSPSLRPDYHGIFFFNMIQLPLFVRQSETGVILNVIHVPSASWHTCLNSDTGIQSPVRHVGWVSNSSVMRTGLSLNCMDHLCPIT